MLPDEAQKCRKEKQDAKLLTQGNVLELNSNFCTIL